MTTRDKSTRCAVCGKTITESEIVYSIVKGRLTQKAKLWGAVHQPCFATAVDSPDAVLAELKRQTAR